MAGLDVVMRDYFYHKLMEEYTETGRTFVISTHIIEEATDLMEEVVMIKNGEVLLKENTQELLERSYHVSGLAEVVDQATEGYERHHEEKMGRSKSVTILLKEGQKRRKAMMSPYSHSIWKNCLYPFAEWRSRHGREQDYKEKCSILGKNQDCS